MLEAAARHWSVLRDAWADDRATARTRKCWRDQEFLPAALEVIETPASPLGRAVLWALCGLLGVALVWSFLGKLDIVAVAPGRIVPSARVKVIQPSELGVVRAIHVQDGQHVRAGQLLMELDPTMAGADDAQAARGLLVAEIDRARSAALLAHANGRAPAFRFPPQAPAEVVRAQRSLVQTQVAEYEAKRAALVEQRRGFEADRLKALTERAKMADTLPYLDKQVRAREELVAKGFGSKLQLYQLQEERIERARNIEVYAAEAASAAAAVARIDRELGQLRAELAREAAGKFAEAEDNLALRREELRKTRRRQALQRLRSPVDGTVQELSVHTLGGVVQPAEKLMTIVPDRGGLYVEAKVLNKDIGFVRAGQPVRVKVEAFPFTEWGMVDGVVEHVGRDAVEDQKLGLVYLARVRIGGMRVAGGARGSTLTGGMAVQAEIRTGRRRVIDYLLSPITRRMDEAGGER